MSSVFYLVEYKDSDGYEAITHIEFDKPVSQNEIIDILEDQLRHSNIDSKIIYLDAKIVNKVVAKISHFRHNLRPRTMSCVNDYIKRL